MILTVEWINATRPPEVKAQVELTYRNRFLDFTDGVENAYKIYTHFKRVSRPCLHDWQRFNYYAFAEATEFLTPHEKKSAKFKIDFNQTARELKL